MQEKKHIYALTFKISASIIVVAAGTAFLFPEMIIPLIHSKAAPAAARAVDIPQSNQPVRRIEGIEDKSERKLNIEGREISYRSDFFAGNLEGAYKKVDSDMKNNGFKPLQKKPDSMSGMIVYQKGEEIIGTNFVLNPAGIKITYCAMSFSKKTPLPAIPAEMKDIVIGKAVVCFDSGNRNPVIVTNVAAGIGRIKEQIKEKLSQNGWELIPQTFVSDNASEAMILQAKRGTMFCNVAISIGGPETNGMNSITYKITHL